MGSIRWPGSVLYSLARHFISHYSNLLSWKWVPCKYRCISVSISFSSLSYWMCFWVMSKRVGKSQEHCVCSRLHRHLKQLTKVLWQLAFSNPFSHQFVIYRVGRVKIIYLRNRDEWSCLYKWTKISQRCTAPMLLKICVVNQIWWTSLAKG